MKPMGVFNPGQKKKSMKVIALVVVCIVLGAGLVSVLALYLSRGNPSSDLQAQIIQKDNTISALQANIASLQAQISQNSNASVSQISELNDQIATLNDQLESYYNIANMASSGLLISEQPVTQDANATTQVFNNEIYYAGYVVIEATATANTTYAEVIYAYAGFNFDYSQEIGTVGSAVFPVLPGALQINIGNTNQADPNTVNVTATYYY